LETPESVDLTIDLIKWKNELLSQFDTRPLIEKQEALETDLGALMREEVTFKKAKVGYLGADCAEVRRIEAELMAVAQGTNADARRAWLERQRTDNQELNRAIFLNHEAMFMLEDFKIRLEMLKTRLSAVQGLIALKTAQIRFLGG
jgi:hypothetical protein